jgi:hypothetical protein
VQGAAQESLLQFVKAAVDVGGSGAFAFDALLRGILDGVAHRMQSATASSSSSSSSGGVGASASLSAGGSAYHSCAGAARCIAVLCHSPAAPRDAVRAVAHRFLQESVAGGGSGSGPAAASTLLALLSLGEVGCAVNLGGLLPTGAGDTAASLAHPPAAISGAKRRKSGGAMAISPSVADSGAFSAGSTVAGTLIARALTATSDDLRAAAATALGGVVVGSISESLPLLLRALAEAASAATSVSSGSEAKEEDRSSGPSAGSSSSVGLRAERVYLLLSALREVRGWSELPSS